MSDPNSGHAARSAQHAVSSSTGADAHAKVCIIQYNASRYLTRVDRAARALSEVGHEVVLIGLKDEDTPEFEEREGYVVKRITLSSRRLTRRFGLKFLRFAEGIYRSIVAAYREDADIYNPRDAYPLFAAHVAATLRRAKVVYDSDELAIGRNWAVAQSGLWLGLMKAYEGFFARRSAAVITSDFGRADVLERTYRIPRPTVVLNVPESIAEPEPDADFRAKALGDGQYLLIYQGVFNRNRGLPELIRAMRLLPECRLALVGYGPMEAELKRQVESEGLQSAVVFFDAVPYETLMRYTASADIGVIAILGSCLSYATAAPNKLFEYMMVSVPVVASDLPDMARVVAETGGGTLIEDPSDPASIAAAVRKLLDGPESLAVVGARGREAALERYNWACEQPKLLAAFATAAEVARTSTRRRQRAELGS
jgi:glycosyltransferase involved in cell wall biosynthesis